MSKANRAEQIAKAAEEYDLSRYVGRCSVCRLGKEDVELVATLRSEGKSYAAIVYGLSKFGIQTNIHRIQHHLKQGHGQRKG